MKPPFKPTREFVVQPKLPYAGRSANDRSRSPAAQRALPENPTPTPPNGVQKVAPRAPAAPKPAVVAPPPQVRPILAPAGLGYTFKVHQVRPFDEPQMGCGIEVWFQVAQGENAGDLAHAFFPFHRPGLAILVAAALGETKERWDASVSDRLLGRMIVADVVRKGGGKGDALIRDIKPI